MRPLVFVALDFSDSAQALQMAKSLKGSNPYFKIGLELFVSEGPGLVEQLISDGCQIFLDLKFHDIPNTAAGAVRAAVRTGAGWINVHCGGGASMLKMASEATHDEASKRNLKRPKLLGVTVLTSLNDADVHEIGFPRSASAQVKHFVELAQSSGLDGVVCSPHEIALVKSVAGESFLTMVPGIRTEGSDIGDQSRVMTPAEAAKLGANFMVIGRPITKANDPVAALQKVLASI